MLHRRSKYYDGITAGEEFPRVSLMNKFKEFLVAGEKPVFISSPRATGKTSFLQLVRPFSTEESLQLILDDRIGLEGEMRNYPLLHGILERDCNGHIGSLRMSIDRKDLNNPSESESVAIVSHLCNDVRFKYDGCWNFRSDEGWVDKIEGYMIPILANQQPPIARRKDERMMQLIRVGILMVTNDEEELAVEFTAPLSKRYFCQRFHREGFFIKS
jgi:hypothetical protein